MLLLADLHLDALVLAVEEAPVGPMHLRVYSEPKQWSAQSNIRWNAIFSVHPARVPRPPLETHQCTRACALRGTAPDTPGRSTSRARISSNGTASRGRCSSRTASRRPRPGRPRRVPRRPGGRTGSGQDGGAGPGAGSEPAGEARVAVEGARRSPRCRSCLPRSFWRVVFVRKMQHKR